MAKRGGFMRNAGKHGQYHETGTEVQKQMEGSN